MPPSTLSRSLHYYLGYCSLLKIAVAVNRGHHISVFTADILAKLTWVQLHSYSRGKDMQCFLLLAVHVPICRSSNAGSIHGYVAGTTGAYENQE